MILSPACPKAWCFLWPGLTTPPLEKQQFARNLTVGVEKKVMKNYKDSRYW